LNGITVQNIKFLNFLRFNWYLSKSYTIKNSPKDSTHNSSFEIYIKILKFCDRYYFVTNILHTFKFFNICWIFQNNWLNEIYFKQVKIIQDVMSIHYQKKLVAKKFTCDYNFKGVLCAFTCWIQLQKIEHSIEFFFSSKEIHTCAWM
jgi:hypothetical protein